MNELSNRAQTVAALLKDAGQTIGVSESSGGGLISACLLAVPGASRVFHWRCSDVHADISQSLPSCTG